jgi:hypothetical protein
VVWATMMGTNNQLLIGFLLGNKRLKDNKDVELFQPQTRI